MSTTPPPPPTALFLFAHQDDEFGVFQKLMDEQQQGHRVCCAYLTDGGFGGVSPVRRNEESLAVLQKFGVKEPDVSFAGQALSIPDGQLHGQLDAAARWIDAWLTGFPNITTIYVPAWEGGHHDHDALHAIVVLVAQMRGLLGQVRQFSLYNGYECVGQFFKVLTPLSLNGKPERTPIAWRDRLRFLAYCLSYSSQAKAWLGLFPFVLLHYLTRGEQVLQSVSLERIRQRPHAGALYYESRRFFTWEQMVAKLSAFKLHSI